MNESRYPFMKLTCRSAGEECYFIKQEHLKRKLEMLATSPNRIQEQEDYME